MHLLVDHGAHRNLGDAAMLEAVVRRLHRLTGGAHLYVKDCPLDLDVWGWENVYRVRFDVPAPARALAGAGLPALRGVRDRAGTWWNRACHARLGRTLRAGRVHVRAGDDSGPLDRWGRGFDGLHVAGGGAFTDVFPSELWQRCCLVQGFASRGKPVVLTGQQLGPVDSAVTRRSVLRTLRAASFVGLRDPTRSVRLCEAAGLPAGRFAMMGDDALGLPAAEAGRVERALARHGVEAGSFLAVNVRVGYYAPSYARHVASLAEAARRLAEPRGLPVLVVPIALGDLDSDIEVGRALARAVGGRARVLDASARTAGLTKGVLGQAWAALGVSYHFCQFALEGGTPAALLYDDPYYEQKGRGLRAFWGDERLALPIADLRRPDALGRLAATFDDAGLRDRLRRRAAGARREWARTFDHAVTEHLTQSVTKVAG